MPRLEQDREDLLAEATALVERVELQLPGSDESVTATMVVVGFRTSGAASFFFGGDPVYQFNSAGELRRVFADGKSYKADRGRLVVIERSPSSTGRIELAMQPLEADAQQQLCDGLARRLSALAVALREGTATVAREVPPGAEVRQRVAQWLEQRGNTFAIAEGPKAV